MSSNDDQAANPYASPAPTLHPEFGYLCPSAGLLAARAHGCQTRAPRHGGGLFGFFRGL
jgi:hypothetical protein